MAMFLPTTPHCFCTTDKPIITADYPSDDGYYTESWTETESEIKQIWTAAEPPEDISADEALDIITGGADI